MRSGDVEPKSRTVATGEIAAIVGTLASIYMISHFLRSSVGVIAPDLAHDMNLSASEIGLLSSAFFITFALCQIPLGMALDRFGPRLCMLACAGVVVGASLMFAMATTPLGLIVSRALLGIGACCYLLGPLSLYARRYSPEHFGMYAGIQLGVGSIGGLLATAPLAYSAAAIGWRLTFVGVGIVMLIGALAIAFVVRNEPSDKNVGRIETFRESMVGLMAVLRTPSIWRLFGMHLSLYWGVMLVIGLWGAPYLTHVYGFDLRERGNLLLVAALTQVAGMVVWGPAQRWCGNYKIPVLIGSFLSAGLLILMAVVGTLDTTSLVIWLALLGVIGSYTPVLVAHGKALFPSHLVGRGLSILNMGTMGGGFIAQLISGLVMDLFPARDGIYSLEAYRTVFLLQAAALILACIFYFGARDPSRDTP